MGQHFVLLYSHPDLGEQRFALRSGRTYRIGSRGSNDVVIPQKDVSRNHAVLRVLSTGFHITDLNSKNGTFVNGTRVASSELRCGDQIQVSSAALVLVEVSSGSFALAPEIEPAGPVDSGSEREDTVQYRSEATLEDILELFESVARSVRERSLQELLFRASEILGLEGVVVLAREGDTVALVANAGNMGGLASDPSALVECGRLAGAAEPGEGQALRQAEVAGESVYVAGVGAGSVLVVRYSGNSPAVGDIRAAIAATDIVLRSCQRVGEANAARKLPVPTAGVALDQILGASAAVQTCKHLAAEYGCQLEPVMITGESGTGKELLARAVHELSGRAAAPFVALNCAAIPADLIEAELFGVAAGAATGVGERTGRFQAASGGTLFLDEIGDLPLGLQGKLLRVLESNEIYRVGDDAPTKCDVRIVSATNRELGDEVRAGRFRADLYYRLHVLHIHIPPLRERRQDIPLLVNSFLEAAGRRMNRRVAGVTVRALDALTGYAWPGNVRELRSEVVRAVAAVTDGAIIDVGQLSRDIRGALPSDGGFPDLEALAGSPLGEARDTLERWLIGRALESTGGNQTRAAERLGLSRAGLFKKMKRLDMAARTASKG